MGKLRRFEGKARIQVEVQRKRWKPFLWNVNKELERTRDTCLSSDDVGDAHLMVIDHRSKVVSREQVGLEKDGVGWQRSMRIP